LEASKCTAIEASKNLFRQKAMEIMNRMDQLKKAEKVPVAAEGGGGKFYLFNVIFCF
jgi:hypothetical protein